MRTTLNKESVANPFRRTVRASKFPELVGQGNLGIASPWTDGTPLNRLVLSRLIGADPNLADLPTRDTAVTVPAVYAARNLLIQTIGSLPLRAYDRDGNPVAKQPLWLTTTTDVFQSAYDRQTRILDDLLFTGYTLLEVVERGADGYPLEVLHVRLNEWQNRDGKVYVRDGLTTDFIFIRSPFEGLLNVASRTIQHALSLEETINSRSQTPNPHIFIRETEETNRTDAEIDDDMDEYARARRSRNGAVSFLPLGLDVVFPPMADGAQAFLLEARNAVVSDIAKFTGLPSGLLEGTSSIDSITYTTEKGQRSRFVDYSLRLWLDPIQERLSLGDVCPNGVRIEFDLSDLTSSTPEVTTEPEAEPALAETREVAAA